MDWITTSGASVHEAKSNALDQLGIVADEAEFDIINDVEKGLFGRVKQEAKVRTRVRPKAPVVKDDRRSRGGSGGSGGGKSRNRSGGGGGGRGSRSGGQRDGGQQKKGQSGGQKQGGAQKQGDNQNKGGGRKQKQGSAKNQGGREDGAADQWRGGRTGAPDDKARNDNQKQTGGGNSGKTERSSTRQTQAKKDTVDHEFSREEQERVAIGFLEGVLGAFEMQGSVALVDEPAEDEAIELAVTGSELGLLVGQKGVTLNALQELTRTVVQREADGAKTERLRVDVGGYRERRRAALEEFARKIAVDVVDSDSEKVLEPMGPADRKVVHDALSDFDGVETGSEGEEPRRRVVIRPV